MNLPHWVEKEIEMLPAGFSGQIVIECWTGGVTRFDMKTSRTEPKPVETVRHVLRA